MVDARRIFGDDAEALAARYLSGKGLKMIGQQFRTRFGEIDLIAKDGSEIVFVEVKARKTAEFGYPEAAVTPSKLKKIYLAAMAYLQMHHMEDAAYRIDVIAIEYYEHPPKITHIEAVG